MSLGDTWRFSQDEPPQISDVREEFPDICKHIDDATISMAVDTATLQDSVPFREALLMELQAFR